MNKPKLTVGSLFAGIGGFDLGLERTGGFEVKWQVEIDDYCQRVLAKHWPHVKRYGDIRTVSNVERVDVLCGGFPCQDISNAGKRAGIDGERSGLWSEYVRLIRMVRPRYVIVENVAALLGRGMGRVLGDLSESGYDTEWDVIRASDVGAPHRRERVWIVAQGRDALANTQRHRRAAGRDLRLGSHSVIDRVRSAAQAQGRRGIPCEVVGNGHRSNVANAEGNGSTLRDSRSERSGRAWFNGSSDGFPDADRPGLPQSGDARATNSRYGGIFTRPTFNRDGWWATEPDVGRVAHGIPARVDRLKGLGNAIVPQIATWIGNRILEAEA